MHAQQMHGNDFTVSSIKWIYQLKKGYFWLRIVDCNKPQCRHQPISARVVRDDTFVRNKCSDLTIGIPHEMVNFKLFFTHLVTPDTRALRLTTTALEGSAAGGVMLLFSFFLSF